MAFSEMSAEEWVDYELKRQEKFIDTISNLPWEEFVEKQTSLTAHIAKAQVLKVVQTKLRGVK
tara:strand:- start:9028 stop:9216 length:189 start_codon:yes stop_codon:yes gene_type:complete